MEKFNSIEKGWITALESSDISTVITAIHEIKNSGSVNILPVLFKMINRNTDVTVRTEIFSLLSEIRSKEAVPIIVEAMEMNDYGDYLPSFLAACWMSGLDFSRYLCFFSNLFIREDYQSAIEAFTVIEESLPHATDIEIAACIHFLKDADCMVNDAKMPLYKELRKVVEGQY
jgi:hypothetical protein